MKPVSCLRDTRIGSNNYLVELTIREYIGIAKDIIHKNEFQRKKVRSSKTVYSLLKADLKRGCILPPIVLALTIDIADTSDEREFSAQIHNNKEHLVILDGLQRTNSILDMIKELESNQDEQTLNAILDHNIRAEFYVGINRLGVLYRMLTLNTGQTPMSLRQQIEMLYLDYANVPIDGITLNRESEGRPITGLHEYSFREIVEGFNSYIDRDELPIDRTDILDNIKSLEKLSIENQDADLFVKYLSAWDRFIAVISDADPNTIDDHYMDKYGTPFGENLVDVFKKSQALTGFAAAVGKLKDFEIINGFDDVATYIQDIEIENSQGLLERINVALNWLKNNTKRIGNAQRSYFHYFFREIFNPENENFKKLYDAADSALKKYQTQNM